MWEAAFQSGNAITLTVLTAVEQSVEGALWRVDGRYLQLQLPTRIPCGSLLRVENRRGDVVLGEAVHCERGPQGLTIMKAEHALSSDGLEAISRCVYDAAICNPPDSMTQTA